MFKLNIGTQTATISEYDKRIRILAQQRVNINNAITELTEAGWSGEARDKFIELHQRKQAQYEQLEAELQYMKNALENEVKPRVIKLKRRSEDFVNCIKRTGSGGAFTSGDEGVITLEASQFPINNNVMNCTNDYYPRMHSKFQEIMDLVNRLEFTSFGIGGEVWNAETSLRNQTSSLTDFDDSFNIYCNDVRELESAACFVFNKISEMSSVSKSKSGSTKLSREKAEEFRKLLIRDGVLKDDFKIGVNSEGAVIKSATNDSVPLISNELIIDKYDPYMKVIKDGMYVQNYAQDGRYYLGTVTYDRYTGMARFHAVDKEEFDKVSSCFSKEYWTSVKKAALAGGIQFSQSIREGIDVIGENLLDYDRCPVGSDKTFREIAEEDREKYIEDLNKLREEAPYKRTFDDNSKISNDILNTADIALAAHSVVKLGEVGVNYVKSVAPEIKSIFSENGLSGLENISGNTKTVTFNSMEFAGDLSEGLAQAEYNISTLNNTGNFRRGSLEHILEGELNARGKAVGFHYEGMPTAKGNIIQGTESVPNQFGIYIARVEVNGVPKVGNGGTSTFFPKSYNPQNIVDSINEAYSSRQFIQGTRNTFRGQTSLGIIVEMYIDSSTGKIISAFPKY